MASVSALPDAAGRGAESLPGPTYARASRTTRRYRPLNCPTFARDASAHQAGRRLAMAQPLLAIAAAAQPFRHRARAAKRAKLPVACGVRRASLFLYGWNQMRRDNFVISRRRSGDSCC
jgi:hypothetical protein